LTEEHERLRAKFKERWRACKTDSERIKLLAYFVMYHAGFLDKEDVVTI